MRTGSYRLSEREQAIVGLVKLGISDFDIRGILRDARTLARLAEAQCNGDWPCDNGQRKVEWCARCGGGMVRSRMKVLAKPFDHLNSEHVYLCQDCAVSDRVAARLKPYAPQGIGVELAGDPRGYVVKVWQAQARDGWAGIVEVGIA